MNKNENNSVYVYCELEGKQIEEVSFELLTKGRKLANELGVKLEAVVAGSGIKGEVETQILPYGVDVLHVFDSPYLSPYTTRPHTAVLVKLFEREQPQICLMGATSIGRDLGPRVSSSLTSGLTADCTALEIGNFEDKKNKKTYENRPQMATVRSGVMKAEVLDAAYKGEVIYEDADAFVAAEDKLVEVIHRQVEKAQNNLKGAPIVVAGGYGVGSKENFDLLRKLANELHGEVGASRAAVDAGFANHEEQIGQTGVTVRPKVYIACGISGAIQHVAGMKESGILISINTDPNAPINDIADYVITGSVEEVVPKMIQYYKQHSK